MFSCVSYYPRSENSVRKRWGSRRLRQRWSRSGACFAGTGTLLVGVCTLYPEELISDRHLGPLNQEPGIRLWGTASSISSMGSTKPPLRHHFSSRGRVQEWAVVVRLWMTVKNRHSNDTASDTLMFLNRPFTASAQALLIDITLVYLAFTDSQEFPNYIWTTGAGS